MANYLRVYFIELDEFTAAPAPPEQWDPATFTASEPEEENLLEWLVGEHQRIASYDNEEDADARTEYVLEVLFGDEVWEDHAPGLEFGANMRGTGEALEDLQRLAENLLEPLRSRISSEPEYDGRAEFPPDLPEDSPIRVFDLGDYKIFYRNDLDALFREYDKIDKHSLVLGDDESEGWGSLFNEENRRAEYDFALFDYEG